MARQTFSGGDENVLEHDGAEWSGSGTRKVILERRKKLDQSHDKADRFRFWEYGRWTGKKTTTHG